MIEPTKEPPAPSWSKPEVWAGLEDGSACPLCDRTPSGVIATLPSSFVTVNESVSVRGYCCLILRRHATELHHLDEAAGAALMRDIQKVSRAVQKITGAIKLNYEVHGNVIPHVHMHIVPRYSGDAIEATGRGFAALTGGAYEPGEFEAYARALSGALSNV
jgi:diadenosine tetraphosphate (Ap4A) HIT family hydrolase